jgi:hypothetical protein
MSKEYRKRQSAADAWEYMKIIEQSKVLSDALGEGNKLNDTIADLIDVCSMAGVLRRSYEDHVFVSLTLGHFVIGDVDLLKEQMRQASVRTRGRIGYLREDGQLEKFE